jgi:hypothetical protein
MNSALLVTIEQLFLQKRDEEANKYVQRLALSVLLQWERDNPTFRAGLVRINWWENDFARTYPLTFERLKKNIGRRANASALTSQLRQKSDGDTNVWRSLYLLILESDRIDRGVWQVGIGSQAAIQTADEFGIDQMHMLQSGGRYIKVLELKREGWTANSVDLASPALVSLSLEKTVITRPIQLWCVPFQKAVIVLLQNINTGERELVWIQTDTEQQRKEIELSDWAINHNNLTENPEDFCSPPFLHGDPTLESTDPIITSTEGRVDIPTAKIAITTVTIRKRDTLLFDQVKEENKKAVRHWRHLLTHELWEPRSIPLISACFVLDSLLLYASNDGILRAHPRGNPNSTYHVEGLQSLVPHMTSLFNVVALIHSHDTLEVRHVEKQQDDPFLRFRTVYKTKMVDANHKPLLYGPYVIFRSLDTNWYRVMHDSTSDEKQKEQIKIPFKAGWIILSIKNANWRYWTVVLKSPRGDVEEFILFAGGLAHDGSNKPFLIAACIDCGEKASHLCQSCMSVAFCNEHIEHEHRDECTYEK